MHEPARQTGNVEETAQNSKRLRMQNEHFETSGLPEPARNTDLESFSSTPTLVSRTAEVSDTSRPNGSLRDERAEWQVLFEHMLDGFAYHRIVLDENGTPADYVFLDVNPAFEEFTGLRKENIVGKRITEVLSAIERSEFDRIEAYGHVALTGEQMSFVQHSERMDRWYKVRAYSPREGYFVTLFEDITERRRAEEALRKLSRAVEQSPSTVLITDTRGSIEYVNPRFTELTGYSREEAIGQNPRILKTEHTTPEEYREMWTAIRSGRVWRGEFLNRKKNGELYWEEASISPITNSAGEITHFVAVKQNITEQKAAEAERARLVAQLQDTNARLIEANVQARAAADEAEMRAAELDTTISSMADGVVICGPETQIVRMNRSAEEMLGLSAQERDLPLAERWKVLGVRIAEGEPIPPEEIPASKALRGETSRGVVIVTKARDGRKRWVSVSAAPLWSANGKVAGAVETFTDVTELHMLQEQQRDILRAVSHDLRNPLTSVLGQAQLLQRALAKAGLGDRLVGSAEAIVTSAKRMNAMIGDLTDAIWIESGQLHLDMQPVNLPCLIFDLLHRSSGALDTTRVTVEMSEHLPQVEADPNRLERVLVNLISNALKYSDPEAEVAVGAREQGEMVEVTVADAGAGMSQEELPHLFERFYRAKGAARKASGLGLGLYITRMLVEAHGGSIWAESEVGKGSVFHFTLRAAAE